MDGTPTDAGNAWAIGIRKPNSPTVNLTLTSQTVNAVCSIRAHRCSSVVSDGGGGSSKAAQLFPQPFAADSPVISRAWVGRQNDADPINPIRAPWLRITHELFMPKLVFIDQDFEGLSCELAEGKTTVGRGTSNQLVLQHESVSASHCEILVFGPEVIMRDLQSSNGTFVVGIRIHSQAQVKLGQFVRFGEVTARLDLAPLSWDDTGSEETAVYAMRRSLRDQRRERNSPKPASGPMKVQSISGTGGAAYDQTVLQKRTVPADAPFAPPMPPAHDAPRVPARKRTCIVLALGAALVMAVMLWRWFRPSW